jgi:hypothetical protein
LQAVQIAGEVVQVLQLATEHASQVEGLKALNPGLQAVQVVSEIGQVLQLATEHSTQLLPLEYDTTL